MELTRRDLDPVNERLDALTPDAVLRWTWETFGRRAALLSSMQRAGTALCHMADRAGLGFDVLFVDTGALHPETLATRDELARTHRRLSVISLHPARTVAEQTRDEGPLWLTPDGQARCCELRKSDPLHTARGRYDALVGSLRRDEGGARSRVRVVDLDEAMGALRVHPFANLTAAQLDAYVRDHSDVLVNPLHAYGYRTIGCVHCTTPVRDDEDDRDDVLRAAHGTLGQVDARYGLRFLLNLDWH